MKQCPRCNLNFPDTLNFCGSCGEALVEVASLRCPACGASAQSGWKYCVKCRTELPALSDLSVSTNRPSSSRGSSQPPTVPVTFPALDTTARLPEQETPSQQDTIANQQIRVRCLKCRNLVDENARFCEFCGAHMFEETAFESPRPSPQASRQTMPPSPQTYQPQDWYAVPDSAQKTMPVHSQRREMPKPGQPASPAEENHDKAAPTLSMLSSYGTPDESRPASFRWWHGLLLFVFFLLFVGALGAGGWWWWTRGTSTTQSQASTNPSSQEAAPATSTSSTLSPQTQSGQKSSGSSADDELRALRQKRINANPSETSQIITSIEEAEKKYPNDYRFSYERAKLSIKGIVSHHEAFEALNSAAAKAIDSGKAKEMLDNLMADKDGDFYKVSRGHHEWEVLVQALSNKDKAALKH